MERRFKIKSSLGNIIAPKEIMTESELREFALQLIQDPDSLGTWTEKIRKDPIEDVLNLVSFTEITAEEIK